MAESAGTRVGGAVPRRVADEADIALLAACVVDPERDHPLVCLTTQPYLRRPMLRPDAVQAALGGDFEV